MIVNIHVLDSAACILKPGILPVLSTWCIILFHCLLTQKLDVLEFSLGPYFIISMDSLPLCALPTWLIPFYIICGHFHSEKYTLLNLINRDVSQKLNYIGPQSSVMLSWHSNACADETSRIFDAVKLTSYLQVYRVFTKGLI
jgi:hypothetical protein